MGTLVRITVETRDPARANEAIRQAFARIHELDLRLSNYRPNSEVNNFDSAHVSRDLKPVLDLAMRLQRETNGAFDVTQTALFDMWRAARKAKTLPSIADIDQARAKREGKLDLGGIAKGYAADEAMKTLSAAGESHALIAVSGDLVAGDPPAKKAGWTIALEMVNQTIVLKRAGVSTSGDTEQYLEAGGKRYSHIIDPQTGLGLTNGIIASVVAKSGMVADALATVVCLVGVDQGTRIARKYGAKVYVR